MPYRKGSLIAGRYEVQQVFGGEGLSSMGIVYKCYDHEHGQVLALKTLQDRYLNSQKIVDQFKREALGWVHLGSHPNIVQAYWAREIDGRIFIALEFIMPDAFGRNTLTHYLSGNILLRQILIWAIQFTYGMQYAQSKGISPHRDIKPDNIMIDISGTVKITDFGLIGLWQKTEGLTPEVRRLMEEAAQKQGFLSSHDRRIVAGSPPWMAPEQFFGIADSGSDIYGFGVILYQLSSGGALPFRPKSGDTWAIAHKTYPIPPLRQRAKPLEDIIRKCLEKRRDKRYRDFSLLRKDLEEVFKKEITDKTGDPLPLPPTTEEAGEARSINKGLTLLNLNLIDGSIEDFKKGLIANPENPTLHYNLANALMRKGRLDEALRHYKKAISLEPCFAKAHYNLGLLYYKKGSADDALRHLKEALESDPGLIEAYMALGSLYLKKGMLNQSIDAYRAACKIAPESAEAHYRLGVALAMAKLIDEAIASYKEALRLKPDYFEAYNNLGTALMDKGLVDEAIGAYGKALAQKPDYVEAYYNIGIAFAKKELYKEALSAFEWFLKYADEKDGRRQRVRDNIAKIQKMIK